MGTSVPGASQRQDPQAWQQILVLAIPRPLPNPTFSPLLSQARLSFLFPGGRIPQSLTQAVPHLGHAVQMTPVSIT